MSVSPVATSVGAALPSPGGLQGLPEDAIHCSTTTPAHILLDQQEYSKTSKVTAKMFSQAIRASNQAEMIPPTVLKGLSIPNLWNSVFSGSSSFLKDYHEKRKETEVVCPAWEMSPDKTNGYRWVTLKTIVEVPRAGTYTKLEEAHRFAYSQDEANGGAVTLIYHISAQTPDVPAGSTFRCEAFLFCTAESPDAECTVTVMGSLKKMSMAFTAIQRFATPRAIKDMTAGYQLLIDSILTQKCGTVAPKRSLLPPVSEAGSLSEAAGASSAGAAGAGSEGSSDSSPPSYLYWTLVGASVIVVFLLISTTLSLRSLAAALEEQQQQLAFSRASSSCRSSSSSSTSSSSKGAVQSRSSQLRSSLVDQLRELGEPVDPEDDWYRNNNNNHDEEEEEQEDEEEEEDQRQGNRRQNDDEDDDEDDDDKNRRPHRHRHQRRRREGASSSRDLTASSAQSLWTADDKAMISLLSPKQLAFLSRFEAVSMASSDRLDELNSRLVMLERQFHWVWWVVALVFAAGVFVVWRSPVG